MSNDSTPSTPSTPSTRYAFPTLYGREKSGKIKVWNAEIFLNPDLTAYALITYGQEDGKMQETRRDYATGKNIGKSNETSPYQQCMSETERKWLDKRDKEGYVEDREQGNKNEEKTDKDTPIYPMLAQTYDPLSNVKKKKGISYPCFIQPKIDGLRCIMYMSPTTNTVVSQSRTGGHFTTMGHLSAILLPFFKQHPDWAIDGELFTWNYPFEELAGLIKKTKLSFSDLEKLKRVDYHIYDAVCLSHPELSFSERWKFIMTHLPSDPRLVKVQTERVEDIPEFRETFSRYVEIGWEGVMLRNMEGPYLTNYRSHDLQKYKEMVEEEFPIVGWKEGDGRDKGTVIWLCKTPDEIEFSVRPRGTVEQRREWFDEGEKYVGKQLTVIFQEKSEKGVPRFPVGKAVRDGY